MDSEKRRRNNRGGEAVKKGRLRVYTFETIQPLHALSLA